MGAKDGAAGVRRVLRHIQRRSVAAVISVVGVVAAVAIGLAAYSDKTDMATFVLTIAVLIVSVVTYIVASPQPARLIYDREYTGRQDLIFYVHIDPDRTPSEQAATIRVQHHVDVWNEGGRKGVLLRLELLAFEDQQGRRVVLPGLSMPIEARSFVWRMDVTGDPRDSGMNPRRAPFTVEPDDVVTLRFDASGGLMESEDGPGARLGDIAAELERPIVRALTRIVYRQAGRVVEEAPKTVEVRCAGQAAYVQALEQAIAAAGDSETTNEGESADR